MINIAIVEDEKAAANILKEYLARFFAESGGTFAADWYDGAVNFLSNYKAVYDIVFMDIELPDLNGMKAAQKMREKDNSTVLIFVTNMAQFAVKGYEVDALDFIVKPVKYPSFERKLKKALSVIEKNEGNHINIMQNGALTRIDVKSLRYVEIETHTLRYYTDEGEISCWGKLKDEEARLKPFSFMRCNNFCIVNPKYIKNVKGYTVTLNDGKEIEISRPRKKDFMKALAEYLGAGGNGFNG